MIILWVVILTAVIVLIGIAWFPRYSTTQDHLVVRRLGRTTNVAWDNIVQIMQVRSGSSLSYFFILTVGTLRP